MDEVDAAQRLEQEYLDIALRKQLQPTTTATEFCTEAVSGSISIEGCGEPIGEVRFKLGKTSCLDCQEIAEKKSRLQIS